jgi:signal peptidase II
MNRGPCILLLSTLLGLFGCDHGTKHLAKVHLEGNPSIEVIPGVFDLKYTENTDTAFSLLGKLLGQDERHLLLSVLGSVALVVFVAFVAPRWAELGRWQRFGMVLVLGGGLGNLTDRLLRGYVIDFLHLHSWPVFNVADIALCVGAPLVLFFGQRARTEPTTTPV